MIMVFLFLWGTTSFAQSEVEKWNKKTSETNEQVIAVDTTLQDTKETFNNLTQTLGGFFSNRNTIVMGFTGVEFGNEKLSQIQEHFKSIKGVKDVNKHLSEGAVTIKMKSKKGASQIWEKLPQELRSHFKVVQANENTMLMQYRMNPVGQADPVGLRENNRNK